MTAFLGVEILAFAWLGNLLLAGVSTDIIATVLAASAAALLREGGAVAMVSAS